MRVTRDDIHTKADVATTLKEYQHLSVESSELTTPSEARALRNDRVDMNPANKKRKGPQTGQSAKPKRRRATQIDILSDIDTTSPEIETDRNYKRSLTNH